MAHNFTHINFDTCQFQPVDTLDVPLISSFSDNISDLLAEVPLLVPNSLWGLPLHHRHHRPLIGFPLYIHPQPVLDSRDRSEQDPYCIFCSNSGLADLLVSKLKFHFIIPSDLRWGSQPVELLDPERARTHLLHGVIHLNGIGHLVTLNGKDGGSTRFKGRDLLLLWESLWTILQARFVTVRDVAFKNYICRRLVGRRYEKFQVSMKTRLLYGIAYRHTWFGRLGYGFEHASFGVSKEEYLLAIDVLGGLELSHIEDEDVQNVIKKYENVWNTRPSRLRDLIAFLLDMRCGSQGWKKIDLNTSLWRIYNSRVLTGSNHYRTILNTKVFSKPNPLQDLSIEGCTYRFMVKNDNENLPGMISLEMTVAPGHDETQLRNDIQTLLRCTYHVLSKFIVTGMNFPQQGKGVVVTGHGVQEDDRYLAEGGIGWRINCTGCGTQRDDGEEMIQCGKCGVWMHNKCLNLHWTDEEAQVQEAQAEVEGENMPIQVQANEIWICTLCDAP